MFTWFFKYFKRLAFKAQSHLKFASHRATKEVISSHISEILERLESSFLVLVGGFERLKQYIAVQQDMVKCKDEFGVVRELEQPLFTPSYVAKLRRTKWFNRLGIFVFTITEGFLFYLISNKMIGGIAELFKNGSTRNGSSPLFMYITLAFSFAMGLMAALGFDQGIEKLFTYYRAKQHFGNKKIEESEFRKAKAKFVMGIIVISTVVLFSVGIGLSRIFLLHTSGDTGGIILAVALLLLAILAGAYMGISKSDADEASDMLTLYKKWKANNKAIDDSKALLLKGIEGFRHKCALINEKSYQLVLDLQTIYGQEIDERDATLYNEFKSELLSGNFRLTDLNYRKYQSLHTVERMLHDYSFINHQRLVAMSERANEIEIYITSLNNNTREKEDSMPESIKELTATNGHSKSNNIIEDAEIIEPDVNQFSNQ